MKKDDFSKKKKEVQRNRVMAKKMRCKNKLNKFGQNKIK